VTREVRPAEQVAYRVHATEILQEPALAASAPGWPGPYDQQAGLAQAKYIVVDMFARAVQGDSPEAAVAWAENELKQVYV
jgi:hypothetical protein